MKNLFDSFNISLSNSQEESFKIFKDLLLFYNEQFNLTAIKEEREIVIKHFIDSLLPVDNFVQNKTVLDVGSGGGFPAIPIKIFRDDLNITCLEATGKKCTFIKTVIDKLDLHNIKVINNRAEDLAKDLSFRESFDYVTARAVARLNTLCEYTLPFVKVGGFFFAYKSMETLEEVKEAENAIKILGGSLKEIKTYSLGEDVKRTVVIIEKVKPTDKKYPRGKGKERKNPL